MKTTFIKHTLFYLGFSIIVVLFGKYTRLLIVYIDMLYTYLNLLLIPLFNPSHLGHLVRSVVSLTLIPISIAAVPTLFYRFIMKKQWPYFFELSWALWLVITISKVLIH